MISRHSSVGEWMRDPQWAERFQAVMAQAGMAKDRLLNVHALSFHQLVVLSQGRISTPHVRRLLAEIDHIQDRPSPGARDLDELFLPRPPMTDHSRGSSVVCESGETALRVG